jgi:ATP-dependent Clp protease adaptor protein ClpS
MVAEKTQAAPPRTDQLPPFRVLLHNDDVNEELYVVKTLLELTPLDKTKAVHVMLEAHTTGVSLVLVTHKERAELYQEQFKSKNLTATIEPA